MKKFISIILLLACFTSTYTFAENRKEQHPVNKFISYSRIERYMCRITADLAILTESFDELEIQTEKSKNVVNGYYLLAQKSLNKNEKLNSMIKDYYALWTASINSIMPESGELKVLYKSRISQDEKKLDEMGKRIELELDSK